MTVRKMKAYAVLETCENTGGIVFARHAVTARRHGSCQYSDGDFQSVSCRRAPWADWCADSGIVPASLMIDHGWHFECSGCGSTVDRDYLDENSLSLEDVIGIQDSQVFCCPACKLAHDELDAKKKAFGASFLHVLRDVVRKRFGNVHFCEGTDFNRPHAYVWGDEANSLRIHTARLSFYFPGMKVAPATISFDSSERSNRERFAPPRPVYTCLPDDRDAFEAFAAATKKNSPTPEYAHAQ